MFGEARTEETGQNQFLQAQAMQQQMMMEQAQQQEQQAKLSGASGKSSADKDDDDESGDVDEEGVASEDSELRGSSQFTSVVRVQS